MIEGEFSKRDKIMNELIEASDFGLRRGLIFLRGDFQSGKTQLVKEFLRIKGLNERIHHVNLNLYLLERLKARGQTHPSVSLEKLSKLKTKTRRLFEQWIVELFENFFKQHQLLVLDAIELAINYEVNLAQIASSFCIGGKTLIICVPQDEELGYIPDWQWDLGKVVTVK